MFKNYYLAYGSNLNLNQISRRCYDVKPIGSIELNDYRLVYKGRSDNFAYLTIEPYQGPIVPIGVFEVSSLDINCLDIYEGYPTTYSKCYIPIKIGKKIKNALIYVMNEQFSYHLPSINYIKTWMRGYKDFGFDMSILDKALEDTLIVNQKKKFIKNVNF